MRKIILALCSISCFAAVCDLDEIIANPPLKPITCNGDYSILLSAFYWNAHQDGMEFALLNDIRVPVINPTQEEIEQLNTLSEASYQTPRSQWDFGYKLGIGYDSPCDGWNFFLLWTHFQPLAINHIEATPENNQALLTLWSDFAPAQGSVSFARFIESKWKLILDQLDFTLGRGCWASKRLSMQSYIGFRYANISQDFKMEQLGGSWSPRTSPDQDPLNDEVHLKNDFRGIGIQSGLGACWHLSCGWGIYGQAAGAILYGSFDLSHQEEVRDGVSPYSKTKVLETKEHFRASRAIVDYTFGVQYSARSHNGQYGVTGRLGWEQHLFFHQNQLWRVNRIGNTQGVANNSSGENTFHQRRGTLDTSGITLSLLLEF